MHSVTQKWFGEYFYQLHPKIQQLHTQGGTLVGDVNVEYGSGIGRMIGQRLGRKLGLPPKSGPTSLQVDIAHTDESMIWSRQFGGSAKEMISVFTPTGNYSNGYWTETTGSITIELGVEVQSSEWHWIQRATKIHNLRLPAVLLPALKAKKTFVDDLYYFEVELVKREFGTLVRYHGALQDISTAR